MCLAIPARVVEMPAEDQMNMEASYSLFREKQAAMMVSYAQNSGGGGQ